MVGELKHEQEQGQEELADDLGVGEGLKEQFLDQMLEAGRSLKSIRVGTGGGGRCPLSGLRVR